MPRMHSVATRPLRERPVTTTSEKTDNKGSMLPTTAFPESIYWTPFVAIVFFSLVLVFVFLPAILVPGEATEQQVQVHVKGSSLSHTSPADIDTSVYRGVVSQLTV